MSPTDIASALETYLGNSVSDRTRETYVAVARLLVAGRLLPKSKSRYLQARATIAKLREASLIDESEDFGLPKRWRRSEDTWVARVDSSIISASDLEAVRAKLGNDHRGQALRLCIDLAFHCGLRRSETITVSRASVKEKGGRFFLTVIGKRRKARKVPIPEWLACRIPAIAPGLTPDHLSDAYRRACRKAGISHHFHGLRHTCATNWLNGGVPINKVQRWLGHSDLATTAKYLHILEDDDDSLNQIWQRSGNFHAN